MIKRFLVLLWGGFFLSGSALAAEDVLSISLGDKTRPSQVLSPGEKDVLLYHFRIHNEEASPLSPGATITSITFDAGQFPQGQILRYKLKKDGNIVGTASLPNSRNFTFAPLTITIPSQQFSDFSLVADISFQEDIHGSFQYEISEIQTLLGAASLAGDVPTSNRVAMGEEIKDSEPVSADCNFREEPVCGADGRTYFNRCLSFQKGVEVRYEGICQDDTLNSGELWNCSPTAEPICGVDRNTYKNRCYLNRAEVSADYMGVCFPDTFPFPDTYQKAYDLFLLKKNQLVQIRPRISERSAQDLEEIAQTLLIYDFLAGTRADIVTNVGNFLLFSQNHSDRSRLESEIIALKKVLIEAKQKTRESRFQSGKIPFLDTDEGDWFTPSVQFLKEKGWISGYLDQDGNNTGIFKPGDSVTKAEITKMVFLVASLSPEASLVGPKNSYASHHWAKDYIDKAEKSGFTLWQEDINPEKKASRIEILQLLFEAFGMQPQLRFSEEDTLFSDVSRDDTIAPLVYYGQFLDIIEGYPDGTFQPDRTVSRAEAAKIIERAFYKIPRADHLQISPLEGSPHFSSEAPVKEASSVLEAVSPESSVGDFPEAEAPEISVVNPRVLEQMQRYAVPYISPNYHFYMDVPGLYRFQTFDPQANEIMRLGFARNPMISETDVDFWLKIVATDTALLTDRYTPSIDMVQWDFPREKSDNTFFRLEGPEPQLDAMEMLKDSVQYSNPEEIPVE